jgi:hypothetical protein
MMMRRGLTALAGGVLALGLWLAPAGQANGQDVDRFYHYPYYYFPFNYAPNFVRWPDPRQPFQRPPAYMAYPPYKDPMFRYDFFEPQRYYRGFHFFLDQF